MGLKWNQKCHCKSEVEGHLTTEKKAMWRLKQNVALLALKMEGGTKICFKDQRFVLNRLTKVSFPPKA